MNRYQEAILLRERHRPEDAMRLLKLELADHPDSDDLHYQVCLTHLELPQAGREALASIRHAIHLDPSNSHYIAVEAHVLNQIERHSEALQTADRALTLDAEESMAWISKAFALCGLARWSKMEEVARHALTLFPDNENLDHALTISLRMQGRHQESSRVAADRLQRDPDNDMNLANAGWAHIHAGEHKNAEEKFLAALRLNPENEYARLGLREAYKSRSLIYRLYLKLCFLMARVPEQARTILFIGMFVAYRSLSTIAKNIHPLLGVAIMIIWIIFVFWAHVVNSLMHALLLKDRIARHTLYRREKWDGAITACLILAALILAGSGFIIPLPRAIFAGLLFFAALLSAAHIALNRLPGMIVYGTVTGFVIFCALAELLGIQGAFNLGLSCALLSTWLSFIPPLNKAADQ